MKRQHQNQAIGKRVRTERESQQLTREHLAEKADISTQFLSDIEMGRKSMTTFTLSNIATALMVSSDYLLFGITKDEINAPFIAQFHALSREEQKIAEKMLELLISGFSLHKDAQIDS